MDNWSAWQIFFTTGSVLDYIRYKSIHYVKDTGAITVNSDETDEIQNRGTDYKGTEYR